VVKASLSEDKDTIPALKGIAVSASGAETLILTIS